MGTLTADCPRLDTHCPHKLATSCRLTSTPNCCACADERVHSRTYRVYIDGVGFVQRGTRWQGYCWFCKEFWNNRIAATDPPLEIAQTRIPEIPDQTEFLERWWEFHQGYRIAKLADGTEQRRAVVGEPFKEVSPGFLPRTLDQLRAGVANDARRPENMLRRRRLTSEEERPEVPHESLEDALDNLLQEAEETANTTAIEPTAPPPSVTPQIQEAPSEPPRPMTRREAQLQRARERFARIFGSREEQQQDDYESPLTQMYTRAYHRYHQAEERRADGTENAPPLDGLSVQDRREIEEQLLWGVMRESQSMSESLEPESAVWSYAPRRRQVPATLYDLPNNIISQNVTVEEVRRLADQGEVHIPSERLAFFENGSAEGREAARIFAMEYHQNRRANEHLAMHRHFDEITGRFLSRAHPLEPDSLGNANPAPPMSLDNQPDRPAPKTEAEMTKVLACQVCYQQVADIAVVPCGHMVMCQWCADVVVPIKHSHIPTRPTKCPMCRRRVKQRFKVHTG